MSRAQTAVLAGLLVPALAACNAYQKPKLSKGLEEAAAKWKTGQAVNEGIEKQIAAPGTTAKKYGGAMVLKPGEPIWMQTGKSRVVQLSHPVTRVSIGNPELAGVVVLGPRTILINAKELPEEQDQSNQQTGGITRFGTLSPNTLTPPPNIAETSIIIWDSANRADTHTLVVADFLGEQVMLEVTVAELNRTAMEERGLDFRQIGSSFATGYWLGGSGTGPQIPGIITTEPENGTGRFPLTFAADRPNFAFALPNKEIAAFITLLQAEGLASILAQPKLLALSGQNAVFQVGGEIPIRIVTSFVADVEFKPFGTLVNFLPRITEEGDIILTVTPEVSQPDFQSPVEGIPTFRTRRASTSARLKEGQTLVISGLVQKTRREQERGVPYLKDVPYIGYIFRDTLYIEEIIELMVIVTPHLVEPMAPGTELDLPSDHGPMTREEVKTKPNKAEVTRPRVPTAATSRPRSRPKTQ